MRINLYFAFLLFSSLLFAQFFPVRQYMTYDGMPSSAIYDIDQAPSGMMWFMSAKGPMYYDATSWYSFPDSLKLPTSSNSSISIDEKGAIWVAGSNNNVFTVAYYQDKIWRKAPEVERSREKQDWVFAFCALGEEDEGMLAMADNNKVLILQKTTMDWQTIHFDPGVIIYNITVADDGIQWIATSQGLYRLINNEVYPYNLSPDKLPNNNFLNIAFSRYDSTYYMLGDTWMAKLKHQKLEVISRDVPINPALMRLNKSNLVIDKNGRIFAGSNVPAHYFETQSRKWKKLLIDGLELNINSTRLFCDRENNLWVGDSRGLFKFNLLQFANFNKNTGLGENEVSAIKELSDGSILLANPHYLNVWKDGEIAPYLIDPNLSQNFRILDIYEDKAAAKIYVAAGYGGLLVFKAGDFRKPLKTYQNTNGFVAIEKYKNEIYLASPGGISKIVDERILPLETGYSYIRNLTVLEDRLAISSGKLGLSLYDGEEMVRLDATTSGFSNVYKPVFYQGHILAATRDGIGIIKNDQIVPWEAFNYRLPTYGLLNVNNEQLWIGTDQGIFMFDGNETVHYGIPQGLVGNEVNRNAFIEDQNENIWVGMEKGASMFQARRINVPVYKAKVSITEVHSNLRKNLDLSTKIQLDYDENSVSVNYQSLSYIREQDLALRYQLYDPDKNPEPRWEYITDFTSSYLDFINLSPGNYKFKIQAKNQGYDWGEIKELDWTVDQPYYNQWWFIVMTGLLGLAFAGGLFRLRYNYLLRTQRKLELLVKERTAKIQQLNEQLEQKVEERTFLLTERNKQLREYAFINAHLLRSPLTRIMSVLMLLKKDDMQQINETYVDILDKSTRELDDVIHSINDTLADEKKSQKKD